jgi:diguanylate cyclase (GGDEF)-like protein
VDAARYEELKASGKLPSPKGVALAIIKLLQRDDYRLDELTHLIQSDPAIAGHVLKFANAAIFGHVRPIVALPKAVIALGAFRIRDLVLGFSVFQSHRNIKCGDFDLQRFWSYSLATAIASQELATYAQIPPEENFTVGLLSGVGELSLAALFPDEYGELRQQCRDEADLLVLEQERFSLNRRELCATLMQEWGLPDILIQAAYHCEAPDLSGFADGSRQQILTLALHLAKRLAGVFIAHESSGQWGQMPEMLTLAARLGIAPMDFAEMADRAVSAWREWGHLLEVQTKEIPPFSALIGHSGPTVATDIMAQDNGQPVDTSLTMLLVSDDILIRAAFESQLEQGKINIRISGNDADVQAMMLCEATQLLVLDVEMPDLDVGTICQSVRATTSGQESFILILSPTSEDPRLLQAYEAGADDFLIKPCDPRELKLRLRSIQRQIALRNELQRERRSIMRSADQWAMTHRRLISSAMTDPLTKLPNRRNGQDFLESAWLSAHQCGQPLACLMLDIDFFKRINDTHGHEAGDHVLCQLATLLSQCLRGDDLAFRYGGEEFAVICPDTDQKTAFQVGERIRKAVESEAFSYQGNAIRVTISVGIGTFRDSHQGHEEILHEADQALYRAKESGRNKVQQ